MKSFNSKIISRKNGDFIASSPAVALKQQDIRFDILKAIGIVCIVLAHTISRNSLLFELRNFDVPLMVLVSGSLFYISSYSTSFKYLKYLKKRLLRLLAPMWLFLTLFFFVNYLTIQVIGIGSQYSFQQMIKAYFCLNFGYYDNWYTWIFRVFILMAVIAPLILSLWRILNKFTFLLMITAIYTGYELLYYLIGYRTSLNILKSADLSPLAKQIFMFIYDVSINQILFYVLPYGCLFGLGILAVNLNRQEYVKLFWVFSGIFITLFFSHVFGQLNTSSYLDWFNFQDHKYPPRSYYIFYSLVIWGLLYSSLTAIFNSQKIDLEQCSKSQIMRLSIFLSSSSMWVYLWHIFILSYWSMIAKIFNIPSIGFLAFGIVLSLSILITYWQKLLVTHLVQETAFGLKHRSLLSMLFLK